MGPSHSSCRVQLLGWKFYSGALELNEKGGFYLMRAVLYLDAFFILLDLHCCITMGTEATADGAVASAGVIRSCPLRGG